MFVERAPNEKSLRAAMRGILPAESVLRRDGTPATRCNLFAKSRPRYIVSRFGERG